METNKKDKNKEQEPLGTEDYGKFPSGAGVRKEDLDKSAKNADDIKVKNRAKLDGQEGDFESDNFTEVKEDSDLPGIGEDRDIGTAASGAGLGGNKGRGTANDD